MMPSTAAESVSSGPVDRSSWYERTWRWWVLGTLFLATFLNYLDRQTLSVAVDPIAGEFGLTNTDRGTLLAAFIYAYAFAHLFVGPLLDRVRNVRRFFVIVVVGWSISNMLVAFAQNYTQMLWLRYLLGVWEAANFPLCLLLISRIFCDKERSFATGVFNSGAIIGSLAAPKLVIFLSETYNWRYSFTVTGALGILWVIPWLLIFRQPEQRALVWPTEESFAKTGRAGKLAGLSELFRVKRFWGITFVGMGIIPGWYFVSQWLPSYFRQAWNMPYDQALGNKLTLIYLSQGLGLWIGGAVVWWLAARRHTILNARKTVIAASYLMMMSVMLIPLTDSVALSVALLVLCVFGLAAWQANHGAFKQEVSRGQVATVAALVGFAETGFSAFVVQRVGTMAEDAAGYGAVFMMLGVLFSLALAALFFSFRSSNETSRT